jgi:ABC-2 type transport system permease protein
MARLSDVSPVKWSVLALEGAIWRGFAAPDMLLPAGVLIAVGTFAFAAGVAFVKE